MYSEKDHPNANAIDHQLTLDSRLKEIKYEILEHKKRVAMLKKEKKHVEILIKQVYECDICGTKTVTKILMDKHLKNAHCNILLYECPACSSKFQSDREYRDHYRADHLMNGKQTTTSVAEKPIEILPLSLFPCKDCHLFFKTVDRLNYHEVVSHNKIW